MYAYRVARKLARKYIINPPRLALGAMGYSTVNLNKPVFIMTTGRSGSYLLFDILSLSPSFTTPTTRKGRFNKGIFGSENWGSDEYAPDLKDIPVEGHSQVWKLSAQHIANKEILDYDAPLPENADDIAKKIRRRYRSLHFNLIGSANKRKRLLDKAPRYLAFWRLIEHTFPDAQYIICLRDPRAVLNSYLRRIRPPRRENDTYWFKKYGYWGPPPVDWEAHRDKPIVERISWQVANMFKGLLNFEKSVRSNTIRIFYEDIVNNPRKIVSELLDPLSMENSVFFDNLPEKYTNMNPPWFNADGYISGKFGEVRLFHESEREEMADVTDMALHLGYNYDKIGLLTSS